MRCYYCVCSWGLLQFRSLSVLLCSRRVDRCWLFPQKVMNLRSIMLLCTIFLLTRSTHISSGCLDGLIFSTVTVNLLHLTEVFMICLQLWVLFSLSAAYESLEKLNRMILLQAFYGLSKLKRYQFSISWLNYPFWW